MEFHLTESVVVLPPPDLIDLGALYVPLEGVLRVRVPFAIHAHPQNKSMRPTSLKVALIGKTERDETFFGTEPEIVWKHTKAVSLENTAANRRDSLASTFSDVTTLSNMHSMNAAGAGIAGAPSPEEEREAKIKNQIFERAIRQGQRYVDFPFRIKVPTMLPPSLTPSENAIAATVTNNLLFGGIPMSTPLNAKQYKDLILYPTYEVVATLTFSSFSVTAYQTATTPMSVICAHPSGWMDSEPLKKQMGTTSGGCFTFAAEVPRLVWHGKTDSLTMFIRLNPAEKTDLRAVSQVTFTPMHRYRHRDAPFNPIGNQHANLYTPWETTGPPHTFDLRNSSQPRFTPDNPIKFIVPFFPLPTRCCSWVLAAGKSHRGHPHVQRSASWRRRARGETKDDIFGAGARRNVRSKDGRARSHSGDVQEDARAARLGKVRCAKDESVHKAISAWWKEDEDDEPLSPSSPPVPNDPQTQQYPPPVPQ
ncbi:hypothetical protein DFJ73DRAFT_850372, partial [Zopfochytrium polystomum]